MKNWTSQIRSFNRFYSIHIGMLNQYYLGSKYSLTEVRLMYEIGEHKRITAQELCDILNLDKGYLSRTLKVLLKGGMITKVRSPKDGRAFHIELTALGGNLLASLDVKVEEQIACTIDKLNNNEKDLLIDSMHTIRKLLATDYSKKKIAEEVTYRHNLKPGDLGYIIHLHGILYDKESGFSSEFEEYVITTFYDFLKNYSPLNDHILLAECNQKIIGCIAIVQHSEEEAQLRWFLIQPAFRGTGIGKKLLNDALDYCKKKKYKNVFLTTSDTQERAIEMYKRAGFTQTESIEANEWGNTFHKERYDLKL